MKTLKAIKVLKLGLLVAVATTLSAESNPVSSIKEATEIFCRFDTMMTNGVESKLSELNRVDVTYTVADKGKKVSTAVYFGTNQHGGMIYRGMDKDNEPYRINLVYKDEYKGSAVYLARYTFKDTIETPGAGYASGVCMTYSRP